VLDVSTPAYTNGAWPLPQLKSVVHKNWLLTMLSSNVQTINHPTECIAWRPWTRKSKGCSTPSQRSGAT